MDRKGWIILTICAVLLALNFYYMPEKPPVEPKPADSEESTSKPSDSSDSAADTDANPGTIFSSPGRD